MSPEDDQIIDGAIEVTKYGKDGEIEDFFKNRPDIIDDLLESHLGDTQAQTHRKNS